MTTNFSILVSAMLAVASHSATTGEIVCRYDLPMSTDPLPLRYVIDPIKCTFDKDSSHLKGSPSDSIISRTLPSGAFAYGGTYLCLAAISGGCVEGFMANTRMYDYYAWAKDSSSGRIDTTHRRSISSYASTYGIFSSFGPAIVENGDTVSVCWIVTGDARKSQNSRNRILNCLTREDGVNSFSLRRIRPEVKPPMSGITRPQGPAPVLRRLDHDYDAVGRSIDARSMQFSPRFNPGAK